MTPPFSPPKIKITAMITDKQLRMISDLAVKEYDGNLSLALRKILDQYEKHAKSEWSR